MQVFIFRFGALVRWCAGAAVRQEKHERYLFVITPKRRKKTESNCQAGRMGS